MIEGIPVHTIIPEAPIYPANRRASRISTRSVTVSHPHHPQLRRARTDADKAGAFRAEAATALPVPWLPSATGTHIAFC